MDFLANNSLILPLKCEIKFYDNITGKPINACENSGNHGFLFQNLVPIQISYNEPLTYHKYICRSLWYTSVNNDYPISKYYCIFLDGKIFVMQHDYMLQLNNNQYSNFYVTPMMTYDIMTDIIVIDEMYVIDEFQFTCKTCAIKLNGVTLEEISNLPTTLSTYGSSHNNLTTRHTDELVRNSKIGVKNLIIDIDLNDQSNNDNVMIPCDNFEYIEYTQGQHFSIHTDRKRNPMHTHAILVYPPTVTGIKGGELKLYPHGTSSMMSITINMPIDKWVGIIFPIDIPHESLPIGNDGIKKIFKTTGSIVKNFDVTSHV